MIVCLVTNYPIVSKPESFSLLAVSDSMLASLLVFQITCYLTIILLRIIIINQRHKTTLYFLQALAAKILCSFKMINLYVPSVCVCVSGVPPPGPGVMVMQLSVPNGPQPTQNPPMVQWNPCKYYSLEQRPSKPGELYKPDSNPQVTHTQTHTHAYTHRNINTHKHTYTHTHTRILAEI